MLSVISALLPEIIVLVVLAALFIAGWKFVPSGWLTVAVNAAAAAAVVAAEVLAYLAAFNWREVLPPEWAPWAVLLLNVATIVARKRSARA